MAADRMTARRRALAALVTGPLAHFAGGVIDVIAALTRHLWARARRRMTSDRH